MTTITINEQTIAKLEAAGFNRWTKGGHDRLYIDVTKLGLEVAYYNTGNVRKATWQGESVSNADGPPPAFLQGLDRRQDGRAARAHRLLRLRR